MSHLEVQMVKTEEITIDNRRVIVVQLPARKSITLKTQLIKLLGPSMIKLLGSLGAPKTKADLVKMIDRDFDFASASAALETLCSNLSPEQYIALIMDSMASTKVEIDTNNHNMMDVSAQTFDVIFSGELLFMYKVWWFTLKVNYADFFGTSGIGSLMDKLDSMPMPQGSGIK
jgi:hypothetical protein